jgi:hypothetical protein
MSKIFSPGIFISNSYARANMFIKKNVATEQFSITESEAAGDFVISPNTNKYLESFEYILDQKSKNSCEIKLKLIDIDGNLENTILNSSALRNYIRNLSRKYNSDPTNTASNTPNLQSKISSQLKLYIAFGIGDDKDRWAGPYACVLTNAIIEITGNGLRRITYSFLPTNSYMFKSLITTKAAPNTGITNKNYEPDLAFNFIGQKAKAELEIGTMEEYLNYDSNIRKLLINYMDKVTGVLNNTIVMLPHILPPELVLQKSKISNPSNFRHWVLGLIGFPRDRTQADIDAESRRDFNDRAQSEANLHNLIVQSYSFFGIKTSQTGIANEGPTKTTSRANPSNKKVPQDARDEENSEQMERRKLAQKLIGAATAAADQLAAIYAKNSQPAIAPKLEALKFPLTLVLETPLVNDGVEDTVDWWEALVGINRGYAKMEKRSPVTITAWQESDIRILNFWKEQGIISNSEIPCTIVGGRELILQTLYANGNIIINSDNSSDQLQTNDPLYEKLNSLKYKIGIKEATNLIRPEGENSSFGETVAYDELAFDKANPKSDKDKLLMEEYGKLFKLPVFTNNLINSNILSLSLETGDTYAAVTRISVQSDASKNLADIIFGGPLRLDERDVKKVNEIMAEIEDIFNKPDVAQDPRINFRFDLDALGDNPDQGKNDPAFTEVKRKVGAWLKDAQKLSKDENKENAWRLVAFEKIIANSQNYSLTLPSAVLVTKLIDAKVEGLFSSVKDSRLLDFVKLVTIANSAKPENTNVVSNSIPGGPTASNIASRIFDYMFRYALTLNIRTLPFFYLSGWKSLGTPTMVLSKRLGIVDSNSHTNKKNNFNDFDFFSGLYSIMGFRHIINSTECFSEFTLLKNNGGLEMLGGENES